MRKIRRRPLAPLPQAELAEEFARLPPLKLVTIHENPRVPKGDAVDPSNLPYLHRNPAI